MVYVGLTTTGLNQVATSLALVKEVLADQDLGLGADWTLYGILDQGVALFQMPR